jgi:hypothetical protein
MEMEIWKTRDNVLLTPAFPKLVGRENFLECNFFN